MLVTIQNLRFYPYNHSHLCQFCKVHSETIHHLFWKCPKVQTFWIELQHIFNRRCAHAHNFKFEEKFVLFGLNNTIITDKTCDFITLMAKFYIYRSKVQDIQPNINMFTKELYSRYCIDKLLRNNSVEFRNFWGPYLKIFRSLLVT